MPRFFSPMPGIKIWHTKKDTTVFRLHYSADPRKTPAWAARERQRMNDEDMYLQEYEIDFGATSGSLIYHMTDEFTIEPARRIPHHWTRTTSLDPHPMKPHAFLWGAVDPYDTLWIYREYWPSKVYNMPGGVPDNDNKVPIRDYVEVIKFFESAENPENGGKEEFIHRRVIDYAGRAFGKGTSDDAEPGLNFQTRFEEAARDLVDELEERGEKTNFSLYFTDAKKDLTVGYGMVNDLLKGVFIEDPRYPNPVQKSKLRIMDSCPELIWQIKHNRRRKQTAAQAESEDPEMRAVRKRNDLSDALRYLVTSKPEYVLPEADTESTFQTSSQGISY